MFAPFDEIEEEIGPAELTTAPAAVISPVGVMQNTSGVISQALQNLDKDDVAAIMGVATSDGSVKTAFAVRTESGWSAVAWFERKDGGNTGGIGLMKTWKRR